MGLFSSMRDSHPFGAYLGKHMILEDGKSYRITSTYYVSTEESVFGNPWVGFEDHKPMPASELSVFNVTTEPTPQP